MDAQDQPLFRTDSLNDAGNAADRASHAVAPDDGGSHDGLSELEARLGYGFRDKNILVQAITHSGAHHGRSGGVDNERLEFLGDRVLGLIIAHLLIERFPGAREGELGPRLSALVRREALAEVALSIDLGRYLVIAAGDAAAGARANPRMLADAMEAVIAALYLDGGLEAARRFIARAWKPLAGSATAPPLEPKTALQEWAQGRGRPLPRYSVMRAEGKAHDPVFEVMVAVEGLEPASAVGPSKRAAEKAAALAMLERLGVARAAAT